MSFFRVSKLTLSLPLPPSHTHIQDVLSKTQEKIANSLSEVTWREQQVPVRNEKLRVALIKLQQLEGEIGRVEGSSEKMELYEQLMMDVQDSIQIVREDLASETVSKKKGR